MPVFSQSNHAGVPEVFPRLSFLVDFWWISGGRASSERKWEELPSGGQQWEEEG